MKRFIAVIVLAAIVLAGTGCGEEKKDEKKDLVPNAGDMFDKSKGAKGKKAGLKLD